MLFVKPGNMETETALDVLSRAASLLDQGTNRDNSVDIIRQENGSSTDLPVRGNKLRRKERRGQEYLPTKLRTKSRTAGTQTSVSLMQVSIDDDTEEEWMSAEGTDSVRNSDGNSEEEDCDSPLDMTTTNRKSSSPDAGLPENLSRSSHMLQVRSGVVQQRPSVITCASTLFDQKKSLSGTAKINSDTSSSSTSAGKIGRKNDEVRHGHRREILSGMCDPVIDEHFRRSLGKDYSEVFSGSHVTSNTVTVSGLSVDDHFAKALGETWLRLQGKLDSPESNSATKGSSPQTSLQTTASSAVQQQRNILNTQKSLA